MYPGNTNDDCISCPASTLFLNANTGNCVAQCPPFYFGNTKMNQCRDCDVTCYQCSDRFSTSCTACTDLLYFNPSASTCVTNCETYGLTKSLTTANLCVVFDATASLVNVDTVNPINPWNFTYLEAKVTQSTSPSYTTNWLFDSATTLALNNGTNITLDANGPFTSDTTKLGVKLNASFFALGFKYNFILQIIRTNDLSKVVVTKNWTLIMNAAPKYGYAASTPTIGLRNTTTFVLSCLNFTDDNSKNLTYQFYSIEANTSTTNTIQNWTSANETFTNFTVRYYQVPSTVITVYCSAKDAMGAVTTVSTNVNHQLIYRLQL